MPIHEYTTEINKLVSDDVVQDPIASFTRKNKKLRVENQNRITTKHRKNSKWLQWSGNSEKPENDTKIKILEFQENCHKLSLIQRLEQFLNVTPCDKKCNFFILLQRISLLRILHIGIIPIHRDGISQLVQNIANGKNNESYKYMIYGICSNILSKWIDKIFHIETIPIQWIRRKVKGTKCIVFANSLHPKKVSVNPV